MHFLGNTTENEKKIAITSEPLMLDAKFFFQRIPKFLPALNTLYQSNCSISQVKSRKQFFLLILLNFL